MPTAKAKKKSRIIPGTTVKLHKNVHELAREVCRPTGRVFEHWFNEITLNNLKRIKLNREIGGE